MAMSSGPLAFQTNAAQGRSVACASEKGVPESFQSLASATGSQLLHQEQPFSTRPGDSMPRIRFQTAVRRCPVFNSLVLGLESHTSVAHHSLIINHNAFPRVSFSLDLLRQNGLGAVYRSQIYLVLYNGK